MLPQHFAEAARISREIRELEHAIAADDGGTLRMCHNAYLRELGVPQELLDAHERDLLAVCEARKRTLEAQFAAI